MHYERSHSVLDLKKGRGVGEVDYKTSYLFANKDYKLSSRQI
jgi:hypothetical protein